MLKRIILVLLLLPVCAAAEEPNYLEALLSQPLAGIAPKGRPVQVEPSLPEVYAEYAVNTGYQQTFGKTTVRVYQAGNAQKAYGLYTFHRNPDSKELDFTLHGDEDGEVVRFYNGSRFVEIVGSRALALARALDERLKDYDKEHLFSEQIEVDKQLPAVVRNLPFQGLKVRSIRYLLGPKALERVTGKPVSQYDFYPNSGSEFALADYEQDSGQTRLLVIEYHTPQQAHAAFTRLQTHRSPDSTILVKREGNYVVEAFGATSQAVADSVEYNYTVKWLNQRSSGLSFASEVAKTAQILVSVVSIIGIGLLVSLLGGIGLGVVIFQIRRTRPGAAEAFSDAGGMVRLHIVDGLALQNPKLLSKPKDL